MASDLIIDLSAVDLTGMAATPEEVARVNPQAGHMRHLDHVVWISDDLSRAVGVKQVRPDEFWVAGHIPGRPIFPGVLMIEAVAQLSSFLFKRRTGETRFLGFTHCNNTDFRGQVLPGDKLLLLVREIRFGTRRFSCAGQAIVDGRLAMETEITGMVI